MKIPTDIEVIERKFFAVLVKGFIGRDKLSDDCKEMIVRFRQALKIKPNDYVNIMKSISRLNLKNNKYSVMNDALIFKIAVKKSFENKVLPRIHQTLIKCIAEILMISREERVKILRSMNYRGATDEEEKKGEESYSLHDFVFVQSLIPEVHIKVKTPNSDSKFLGEFVKNTGELCLFYYEEGEQCFIALGDVSGKQIYYRHEISRSESDDLINVFSRELLDAYLIKLIRNKNTYIIYRSGRIDLTGNNYRGFQLCRDEETFDQGIDLLKKAVDETEMIYGLNIIIGRQFLEKNDLPKATKYLYKEERYFPMNTGSATLLSELFLKRSKNDRAKEYKSKSYKNDPFCMVNLISNLERKAQDLEQNLEKVFSYLLLCTVIYPEAEEIIAAILNIKSQLEMPELEVLILEENKVTINPIKRFMTIRDLFLAGYYSMAVMLSQEFIEEYEELLKQNMIFRLAIRDFLFFQIKTIPDKTVIGNLEIVYGKL